MRRTFPTRLVAVFSIFLLSTGAPLLSEVATNGIRPSFERPYLIKKLEFQEIGPWYETYVRSALADAASHKADLIILEMDSPGGRVDSALKIVNQLLDLKAHLVVFVNKNAISAGALISLTGKEIYMNEGSVIGASTPVTIQGQEMKKGS
ncbi:MAG: ATP-dependent Clp protease proteolytic subunit, partial [Spirochaetia bacterium]|nr:ATP-dependent Clp protease proteolytic subunit [Spirochaetia bacterium]